MYNYIVFSKNAEPRNQGDFLRETPDGKGIDYCIEGIQEHTYYLTKPVSTSPEYKWDKFLTNHLGSFFDNTATLAEVPDNLRAKLFEDLQKKLSERALSNIQKPTREQASTSFTPSLIPPTGEKKDEVTEQQEATAEAIIPRVA